MIADTFRCYLVKKTGKGQIEAAVELRPLFELPAGDVTIRVAYSSVNYKDALAAGGHPGVARKFPHVPGVDAAGIVVKSDSSSFHSGDPVLVTSYQLGVQHWGGWAQYVRVPAEWVIPLPAGLSLEESMILGTAGLTAGLSVQALEGHHVAPDSGEVLVTGASGGVGSLAVMLLAKLGYRAVAVSGKPEMYQRLKELGAARVVGRGELSGDTKRPLLSARWAGAVDTVGGPMLGSLLRSVKQEGCVAACGLVGGAELATTVYPFILRGITLRGIDSASCPMARRRKIWNLLAGPWKPALLHHISRTVGFDELPGCCRQMLSGNSKGRTLLEVPH